MTSLKLHKRYFLQFAAWLSFLLFVALWGLDTIHAQPVLSAKNTALGSGGTAYLTGFEATFWNPANLMIHDHYGQLHIGIGNTGVLYEPVLSSDAAGDQYFNFTDSFYPYKTGTANITATQRNSILENNYPRNKLISQHQTRGDIILGGALWQRKNEAFSIAARLRFASRIDVGRGWYSDKFIPSGNDKVRDFTLDHQKNYLYELSFGYAREFTYIDGLLSRLSKLYVGIAPKIVLAGPHIDAQYHGQYVQAKNGNSHTYISNFSYRTTGQYTKMTSDYLRTSNASLAISNNLNRKFNFQNTGYGMGFDFGLTYFIPLGTDLPTFTSKPIQSTVTKSIRISFSINDIGMVRYNKKPLELSSARDTTKIGQQAPMESMFIGADGQYLSYFEKADSLANPLMGAQTQNDNSFVQLLPTSLNAGVLLDLSRLKVMGDLTIGLNNTAFTTTKLALHLGLETRPVKAVPIRFGMKLAAGLPTHLGLGTGIETKYWDFNVGAQVLVRSRTFTSEVVGGAFAGLQIHI